MKRSKLAPFRSGLKDLLLEYCSGSSIHGVQYMGCRNRSWCERFWWMVVFAMSVGSCAFLIRETYVKWVQTPVIVSFAEKSTPVWQIPFPAVTICPQTKVQSKKFNFTEEFDGFLEMSLEERLSHNRSDEILAIMHLCERNFYRMFMTRFKFPNFTSPRNYGGIIQNMSLDMYDYLADCSIVGENLPCPLIFKETMTEDGVCATFNGLSANDLLRTEVLQSEVSYIYATDPSPHWTQESGYSAQANLSAYPFRTLGSGIGAGLFLLLRTDDEDIDYICRGPVQGFKVLFHSPADYPQISKKFFHIPMEAAVSIAIKPQMITTNPRLRDYTPEVRHCFFNHERYLQFFRVYSQDNCELECLTNFTLRHCGCVKFSMPRTNQTRMCDPDEIRCMIDAESTLMEMDLVQHRESSAEENFRANCNCLPGCTSMQYDAEITTTDFEWMNWVRSMKLSTKMIEGMQISYLGIYYKEPQFMTSKRSELYGMTDFLANCGGIMGLCMGISLLSLVELVYFCSVRPAMLWRGNRKRKRKSRKQKMEECADVCLEAMVVKSD
ncbi:hypothetical protein pipiens_010269 [Culex pipiens pipiens]|uniref:Pickpocket n=1 Tax=Culex pipiens pipiens TaxID=38569 RepID=A0ABD1DAV9_CULPP